MWCIPKAGSEYVACMENVLDQYERPYDAQYPQVCFDEGLSDPQIISALNVSRPCVERIRKRFVLGGLEKALNEDPRPGQKRKLDGRAEATLIATACSQVPEGYEHWTLRLLAGKMVELDIVESVSYETIRRTLKKTR